ncbi:hypothetical protein EVG20_g1747 [Dentipellis fragilis]|uniref:Uncharacterized protein n=1 Tax=Dentipellis fragilis TaxID=205917 RepID=A0A4Y9ZBR0_9AGAM|nr:hypothetical protein EVG20_g1747 [Dentipellis fragilis]
MPRYACVAGLVGSDLSDAETQAGKQMHLPVRKTKLTISFGMHDDADLPGKDENGEWEQPDFNMHALDGIISRRARMTCEHLDWVLDLQLSKLHARPLDPDDRTEVRLEESEGHIKYTLSCDWKARPEYYNELTSRACGRAPTPLKPATDNEPSLRPSPNGGATAREVFEVLLWVLVYGHRRYRHLSSQPPPPRCVAACTISVADSLENTVNIERATLT